MARNPAIRLVDHVTTDEAPFAPATVTLDHEEPGVTFDDGVMAIEHGDGRVTIDFNPERPDDDDGDEFDANLADKIEAGELTRIASDLLTGIQLDDDSRKDWLTTRERGITLLGLKLEEPRGDVGTSSAPLEGMATVRHPLLLEAVVRFQATARGELLPSVGPVKVRNDSTTPPTAGRAATPPTEDAQSTVGGQELDELATALEKDMNHYLTVTASEYVPDTDRMLFYVGFGGQGFKKVYNCPLRRRPVSESVDAEDIIVSNAATNLSNCGRVTHRIKMRPSVVRRMQILGAYRDVKLERPGNEPPNPVDLAKAEIAGVKAQPARPEDADYTLYECYCELDLDQFAPEKFKGKGLALPYRVTIERESRQVLDLRRNWDDDDTEALPKQFFVEFPFIRGLGFYGIGYIHMLGNVTMTLTACWREMLDNGMFANFPGFMYAKQLGRQPTNQFRVPPGGGVPIDVGTLDDIRKAIMPLPYKETGAGFTGFATHVEEVGQRLGQTANIKVGEGKQDVPVGTTLALIEQATMMLDSVHKRLHASQAEEFRLLAARFREDPEAFWRHNKQPTVQWTKDQFVRALDQRELVPVADPNNPTSLHRIAKALAIKQLQKDSPTLYDPVAVDKRIFRIVGIDPEGLFNATPAAPPPDPRMHAIQAKAQAEGVDAQIRWAELQIKVAQAKEQMADKAQERQSRERIEALKLHLEQLRVQQEYIIHAHDIRRDDAQAHSDIMGDQVRGAHELHLNAASHGQEAAMAAAKHEAEMQRANQEQQLTVAHDAHVHHATMTRDAQAHQETLARAAQTHEQKLEHARALGDAKVAAARALAKTKPKPTGKT